MADNLTPEQRRRSMSRVRRRDTKPEVALRQALWAHGLRGYRTDDRRLPGRPDVAFSRSRVAVFVDGAFWHGHPSRFRPGQHGEYWDDKIARNMSRDRAADQALAELGWRVIRVWDFQVRRDLTQVVAEVEDAVRAQASPGGRNAS